ncbi:alpha-mannosidase [Actinoplanes philippinensis]|uniref:Glycosyl hydrolases family 38 C-terminal domain-containing protein n=1 Tax=Actinoplanes philippinensis TaxID=35752 RepID=A0A1I2EC56_9ACTN|nr:glycoside hydrolase family 38 C-terminal domain-containing protein [Actinoplanes philippinensis]GIE77120.1 alpha-mannosidase [Actinoplanes philippinensis]SFE90176.1 Glycosyl hydrolases family 38 C-terminal domain-containing protein [Actinoplanes philippinensis]
MRITAIEGTDLFHGPAAAPRQVVRVTVAATGTTNPFRVRVEGARVRTPEAAVTTGLAAGEQRTVEVGVLVSAPAAEGTPLRVTAIADTDAGPVTADGEFRVAATGWTMWMVSHFHYDPVWWNTQRGFTEVWQQLPDVPKADKLRPAFVRTAFDLVRAHLDAARLDDDYRFVLAEIDYLKPYWDVFPEDRDDLRRMLREGRVELVGGMYNEPNTNLTHPESTIRNTGFGLAYQRDVLDGDPRTAWMVDVFGHDPAFPGLMADAGLTSGSWARGPFHHIGPRRHTGDIARMQFPSEFEWISPSGRGLVTAYMANHYVAGWDVERKETLEEALAEAYAQYRTLRQVAATRNVMLPVGHDHNIPSRWCTEIHREWAKRYVWPRFTMGLPRDFFAAVRAESPTLSPQTRDMNPVYTGKDVSYIDTKQAQRAIETIVLDAERLGTLAALLGTGYPRAQLDKAWRLLAYGAHHDAVTGTESDQVYLDLLAGWREAFELGAAARRSAVDGLAARVDTRGPGQAVLVANPLSWARGGAARFEVSFPAPGPLAVTVVDDTGAEVPAVASAETRHPDGTLAALTLSAVAHDVPALGYQVWHVRPTAAAAPSAASGSAAAPAPVTVWRAAAGESVIRNDRFEVRADAARGGALTSIVDRDTGRELLRSGGLGGELVVQEEYPDHPHWGEGPWHLLPKGPGRGLDGRPATVRAEHSPAGRRLITETTIDDLRITREVTLWTGGDRIDFHTHVDGSIGQDRLLRVRFDLDLPGALPVSEVGFAAIGRSFGFPDLDAAASLWTLDNPAHTWAALSTTARIRFTAGSSAAAPAAPGVAFGVAEVVSDRDSRELMVALVRQGVTATAARPDGPRYGALDADSNLPDIRIVVGDNTFSAAVLAAADPSFAEVLATTGRVYVPPARPLDETWVPDADLRGPRDLPVLIVTAEALPGLIADLDDAEITVDQSLNSEFTDYSVALVNHGTPGFVAARDGSLHLSLMRACTGWPSGVWIDGPRRTVPDGSGFALQHWTHTFRYSLTAGPGDWRRAGFVRAGQESNHPLIAAPVPATPGDLPPRLSLGSVEPANAVLSALKPDRDQITARIYETSGTPARARIRLHGGLHDPALADVLGEPQAPATSDGDDVTVDLAPADIVTIAALPATPPAVAVPATEPVQPVFTRYWLHNKGPAPLHNLPVTVHVSTTPGSARITVSTSTVAASGTVDLDLPPGVTVSPGGPYTYDLPAGGHQHFDLAVTGEGRIAARIRDPYGQLLEDVTDIATTGPDADLSPASVSLAPGSTAVLSLHLHNPADAPLRGEAQLLSPYGTWGDTPDDLDVQPWIQGWDLPAGAATTLSFTVRAAADARPGAHWWALARVTALGHVTYTAAVALTTTTAA